MSKSSLAVRIHPVANKLPQMTDLEFENFSADIKANGVLHNIVFRGNTWDDAELVDGRHRLRVMEALGIDWRKHAILKSPEEIPNVVIYVLSSENRRHQTISQRAMMVAAMCKMQPGDNQHTNGEVVGIPTTSIPDAAKAAHISEDSARDGKKVEENGCLSLKRAVRNGEISVSAAAAIVHLPKEEQAKLVANNAVSAKASAIRKKKSSTSNGKPPKAKPEPPVEREPGDDTETEKRSRSSKTTTATLEPLKTESVERVKGQTAIDKLGAAIETAKASLGQFMRAADSLNGEGNLKGHKFIVDNFRKVGKELDIAHKTFVVMNGAWNSSKQEKAT